MDIVIATNNKNKLKEYKEILLPLGINCLSLNDVNINIDPDETGTSFAENSLIKARSIARFTNKVVIADDSGLIIDAMPNELGLFSKRFMENCSYNEKMKEILRRLENKNRSARFICVITLTNYQDKTFQFEGICEGYIGNEIIGNNGFGYDPIFHALNNEKSMAELDENIKNEISHRGIASKKLLEFLKESVGDL